ncbi:MAG: hypothetical protein V3S18_07755 [Dehalococcoidia bacterium]
MARVVGLKHLLIAAALFAAVSCGGDTSEAPPPDGDATAPAPTQVAPGRSPASSTTATVTPGAVPPSSPTAAVPAPKFTGFDLDLSEGTFWEYRWSYVDRSCAQGSGCSTDKDDGVFQVTLGAEKLVKEVPVYEVKVTGKSAVAIKDTKRDFAPRWRYLGISGNQIVGSNGTSLTTLFDAGTGKWAGSGYFTERFDSDELVTARTGNLTGSYEIADWEGVLGGSWVFVGRAASQSQCEMIVGLRICPNEDTLNFTEAEYYRTGIGPLAYNFKNSMSFSGGGFFSSYDTTEWVALIASSLRGDVPAPTPTPVPPTPTPAPLPPFSASPPAFGPVDGVLPHNPDDMMILDFSSGVSLGEAVVEATFVNPATSRWSYGFSFRQSEEETFHAVYVTSGGRWLHFARGGSPESQLDVKEGFATLRQEPGESNRLVVIFGPDTGWFFVNDEFVAELDLALPGAARAAGEVRLLGAVNLGDETAGEVTVFSGFTVWQLRRAFGPLDVDLAHKPGDGELVSVQAGVNVADGVFEAVFNNPRPTTRRDWAHVVLFRATDSEFHTFVVSGSGEWIYALGGDIVRGPVDSTAIDTSANGTNRVRVIAAGDHAWFIVNGKYLGTVSLRGGSPSGDVEAVGALDDSLEIAGAVTSISGFTIWSFD